MLLTLGRMFMTIQDKVSKIIKNAGGPVIEEEVKSQLPDLNTKSVRDAIHRVVLKDEVIEKRYLVHKDNMPIEFYDETRKILAMTDNERISHFNTTLTLFTQTGFFSIEELCVGEYDKKFVRHQLMLLARIGWVNIGENDTFMLLPHYLHRNRIFEETKDSFYLHPESYNVNMKTLKKDIELAKYDRTSIIDKMLSPLDKEYAKTYEERARLAYAVYERKLLGE